MAKEIIRGDRRLQRRYPIELELEYRVLNNEKVTATGVGRTGNISSGGIFFHTEAFEPIGHSVELSIRWPAYLGNTPFIELCVSGRLVRSDRDGVAIRMSRYHFQKLGDSRAAFEHLFTHAVIQ